MSYELLYEFVGEREVTVKQLAEENKCNEKDIKVTIRKPKLEEKILRIKPVGTDCWNRPVYKDEKGTIYKDTNLGKGKIKLCTSVSNNFHGEPLIPVSEDVKIEIVKNFVRNKNGKEVR